MAYIVSNLKFKTMKHEKETYLEILNFFKAGDNELGGDFMRRINSYKDKSFSTNSMSLVLTPNVGDFPDKDISGIVPEENNTDKVILLSELVEKLENFPKVDCFDDEKLACDACYGSGEVDFVFNYGAKTYTHNGECPVCEGKGVVIGKSKTPNGQKDYDYEKSFKIGDCTFRVDRILELLFVAKTLNSDIKIIYKTDRYNQMVFQIDDVTLILMPSTLSDHSIAQTIEI